MAKYRKKPIEVEAEQFLLDKHTYQPEDVEVLWAGLSHPYFAPGEFVSASIKTLEGTMNLTPGDWIITDTKGEKYPCKPDMFEMTYELVGQFEEGVIKGLREIICKSVKKAFPGELDSRDKEYLKLLERKP